MNERKPELVTFQQAEELKPKLDRLIALLSEEIEIHPDTLYRHSFSQALPLGNNVSLSFQAMWNITDRDDSRWLELWLRDPMGQPILYRTWRCVWHSPDGQQTVSKPSWP